MYKAQESEGVFWACVVKTSSYPCALYIGGFEHARPQNPLGPLHLIHSGECPRGFWGRAWSKPRRTYAPIYKAQGSERVLSMHAPKTFRTLAPMYKAQESEGILEACMLKTPSDRCTLYIGANARGGF